MRARVRLPLLFFAPTLLAVAIDLALRARSIADFALQGKAIYASSILISAAFWSLPIAIAARLLRNGRSAIARSIFAIWIVPFATLAIVAQALYFRVIHAYVGRDTVRLGIALRGTVRDWFAAWSGPWIFLAMIAIAAVLTSILFVATRRAAPLLPKWWPIVSAVLFVASIVCFWTDNVDSRFLQAATPDACFVHGVVHAIRVASEGKWNTRQGVSLRTPAPLPPLVSARATRPNVLLILTESVRADAILSTKSTPPIEPFDDDGAAPDRIALGKLTSQTPNTFSACMVLWTGLEPNASFTAAHSAPVLWELARAVGYRTAYVTSQNPKYEDFGAFTRNAGIDLLKTAAELGDMAQEQLGAPDERAIDATLSFVRAQSIADHDSPYFAVLHLSNTHAPYRIDPSVTPFLPQSDDPIGDVTLFHNRYKNAVRFQERALANFLRDVRSLPNWERTVVVFLSDHGEQFREHGGLYHNHSLYDEELRVPGFLVAGDHAIDDDARRSIATYAGQRTYMQDVHETIVDLFGLEDARASLPYAAQVTGRSLLHARDRDREPFALLATSTSVWEPDDARFGVMHGAQVIVGAPWTCFDTTRDPGELHPSAASACAPLMDVARQAFAVAP